MSEAQRQAAQRHEAQRHEAQRHEGLRQGESLAARRFGPFERAQVEAYAAASGDDNPLHTDPMIAARAGLARPPVHGMLLVGCFEPFLAAWRPDLRVVRLSAKFIRPVLVDEAIEVSGKVVQVTEGASAVLRIMVKREGDLVCLAEATVTP